jgi:hypothetical protein
VQSAAEAQSLPMLHWEVQSPPQPEASLGVQLLSQMPSWQEAPSGQAVSDWHISALAGLPAPMSFSPFVMICILQVGHSTVTTCGPGLLT